MAEFGFLKHKDDKRKAIDIPAEERDYYLERSILLLEILFREMWHREPQKKDVMRVTVSAPRRWPCTLILQMLLNAMEK